MDPNDQNNDQSVQPPAGDQPAEEKPVETPEPVVPEVPSEPAVEIPEPVVTPEPVAETEESPAMPEVTPEEPKEEGGETETPPTV